MVVKIDNSDNWVLLVDQSPFTEATITLNFLGSISGLACERTFIYRPQKSLFTLKSWWKTIIKNRYHKRKRLQSDPACPVVRPKGRSVLRCGGKSSHGGGYHFEFAWRCTITFPFTWKVHMRCVARAEITFSEQKMKLLLQSDSASPVVRPKGRSAFRCVVTNRLLRVHPSLGTKSSANKSIRKEFRIVIVILTWIEPLQLCFLNC